MRKKKQIIGLEAFQQALVAYVTNKLGWSPDSIKTQAAGLGVYVWMYYNNILHGKVFKLVDNFANANGLQIDLISCHPFPHMIETESGDWIESIFACPCLYIDCFSLYQIASNGEEIGYVFNEGIKVPK